MEIIRGVERRRRWDLEEKLRIVAEAEAPGAVFAAVARRHGVSRGQLWNWRKLARAGAMTVPSAVGVGFLPVRMMAEPTVSPDGDVAVQDAAGDRKKPPKHNAHAADGRIEIRLANGACVRIEGTVETAMLKAAIAAARG